MFRDLKEYQNLQKLYEEKVSKPENINEENVRGANMKGSVNVGNMFKKIGDALKPKPIVRPEGSTSVRQSSVNTNKNVKIDRSRNIPVMDGPVNNPEYGKNMSRSKEDLNPSKVDTSNEIESDANYAKTNARFNQRFNKDVKIVRNSQMTGKQRAQELAKKRIESGKTIQQVKDENKESMRARAAERNKKFQAAKKEGPEALKKLRDSKLTGRERAQQIAKERIAAKQRLKDANIKVENYTPYDMVLEYLLSTEQAATIEEANYVMTEMDADTIQGIVEEQEKNLDEKFNLGKITLGQIGSTALKAGLGVGAYKLAFGGGKGDTPSTPSPGNTSNISDDKNKKKNKGEDLLKQGIEVIKKAKENPGTGLNPNTREALKIMNNNGY